MLSISQMIDVPMNAFKALKERFLHTLLKEPATQGLRKGEWSTEQEKNLRKIRNLKLIKKYGLPKDKIVIMGSSVLVLHGLMPRNDDLDLIVTRPVLNGMRNAKKFVKQYKFGKTFYHTKNKKLEAAVDFQILDTKIDNLLRRADVIDGYHFMSLRDTYRMYRILNRDKDIVKLQRLKEKFKRT